jgi:16S rRNA (adenine1518-N6/adenine1519-N6)-dimethyltransferase
VRVINPQPGEALVEIGPGLGALTQPLLQRCGALTVIELDRDLAPGCAASGLEVIEADVLQVDFAALAAGRKLRVVGNLPYNISTPILFHLLAPRLASATSTSCCRRKWCSAWPPRRAARTTGGCR